MQKQTAKQQRRLAHVAETLHTTNKSNAASASRHNSTTADASEKKSITLVQVHLVTCPASDACNRLCQRAIATVKARKPSMAHSLQQFGSEFLLIAFKKEPYHAGSCIHAKSKYSDRWGR